MTAPLFIMVKALKNLLHDLKPELVFVFLAAFFGFTFVALTPPFQAPDEFNHFYRTFQVSELTFVPEKHGEIVGGTIPASFETVVNEVIGDVRWHQEIKQDFGMILSNLFRPLKLEERVFVEFPNTALCSPVP